MAALVEGRCRRTLCRTRSLFAPCGGPLLVIGRGDVVRAALESYARFSPCDGDGSDFFLEETGGSGRSCILHDFVQLISLRFGDGDLLREALTRLFEGAVLPRCRWRIRRLQRWCRGVLEFSVEATIGPRRGLPRSSATNPFCLLRRISSPVRDNMAIVD